MFDPDTIVYIGQARDIHRRIAYHQTTQEKTFDCDAFQPYPASELDEVESYYINLLQPRYNKSTPGNTTYKFLPTIKRLLGTNMNVLKRFTKQEQLPANKMSYNMADFDSFAHFTAWMAANHPNVIARQCSTSYWDQYCKLFRP